jgi:putative membrane protein
MPAKYSRAFVRPTEPRKELGDRGGIMRNRFHILVFGLLTTLAPFGLAGCQRGNNVQAAREPSSADNTITGADKNFVMQAVKDNIRERVLGKMAEERSQNSEVRDYGKMLVKDHNDALQKLVELMNKNGMPQPSGLPEVRSEAINKLQTLSGPAFDKEFIGMMVENHQKAVEAFQREQNSAQNPDVRDYAKNVLPTLEKHLKEAQEIQSKLATNP